MKVLVACEYSGVVRDAFRARGHDAWSCDIIPADGNQRWHLQRDVTEVIDDSWDLMIAHPPCTYLAVSGMHWTTRGKRDPQLTEDALDFVKYLMTAPIEKICIENPISVISTRIQKPSQIIQPYMFGHNASKQTCLWLKNLPKLVPTEEVPPSWFHNGKPRWANQTPAGQDKLGPSPDRWKIRSKTYEGIARAMAEQWG